MYVALTKGIPSEKLETGNVGTITHVHEKGAAYEVEFVANNGITIAALTLLPHQIRETNGQEEILHVRKLIA
ncbi:MAG: DUF4926 domain-containing protein [Chitinophagaceae bacterium]|nr:MAG: DUF4926 domain-containing protein [Chitinophagaceae bacterium]